MGRPLFFCFVFVVTTAGFWCALRRPGEPVTGWQGLAIKALWSHGVVVLPLTYYAAIWSPPELTQAIYLLVLAHIAASFSMLARDLADERLRPWRVPILAAWGIGALAAPLYMLTMSVYVLLGLAALLVAGCGLAALAAESRHPSIRVPVLALRIMGFLLAFGYALYNLLSRGSSVFFAATPIILVTLGAAVLFAVGVGERREGRLAIWALLLNAVPLLLIAFGRCRMDVLGAADQHRYGIFCSVGMLLVLGTCSSMLGRELRWGRWGWLFLAPALVLMAIGQAHEEKGVVVYYQQMSRDARACYAQLDVSGAMSSAEKREKFCVEDVHPSLTKRQAVAIRQYLERRDHAGQGAR